MANCVTCGKQLHPERAEKYDYCTEPECQRRNATGLEVVAVGVNKAADQYEVLNERTKQQMARGRYKKQPEAAGSARIPRKGPIRTPRTAPGLVSGPSASVARPRWSEAQENLAVIYRAMGMKPHEIAKKLGVTEHLVIKILLAATAQGRR